MSKFIANILLQGKIITKTGLHIGGSKEKLEIGGVDSPVVRDPSTNNPYIPGSSIKGKMRMLAEYSEGLVSNGEVHSCKSTEKALQCPVCLLFGVSPDKNEIEKGPTRLIVRDANPTKETIEMWQNVDSELLYTEYKGENFINRITSEANPRFVERVVPNSAFGFEMVCGLYQIGEHTDNPDMLRTVFNSLRLLQDSTLGGFGSRGYGKIEIRLRKPAIVTNSHYREGKTIRPDGDYYSLDEMNIDEWIEMIQAAL